MDLEAVRGNEQEIDALFDHLNEVFDLKPLLEEWDGDWIFIPVDKPDKVLLDNEGFNLPQRDDDFDPLQDLFPVDLADYPNQLGFPVGAAGIADLLPVQVSGGFPGALTRDRSKSPYPPPDASAFYLPFHYFYPTWWGIYLLHEGVAEVARILMHESGFSLSYHLAVEAARIFLIRA